MNKYAALLGVVGAVCMHAACVAAEPPPYLAPDSAAPLPDASPLPDGTSADAPFVANCDNAPRANVEKCLDGSVGVFVDRESGKDSNEGGKGSPVATLAAAVTKAKGRGNRIFVCGTGYADFKVPADTSSGLLGIYGGFSCAGGTWTAASVPTQVIGAADAEYVVDIAKGANVALQDFELKATRSPKDNNPNSFVVRVVEAQASFARVTFNPLAGFAPAAQNKTVDIPADDPVMPLRNGNPGAPGAVGAGGMAKACSCADGPSTGGAGGPAGNDQGSVGAPSIPNFPGGAAGKGICINIADGTGKSGSNASPPGSAAPALLSTWGTVSNNAWKPADGLSASDGARAQGGGGGAGAAGGGGGSGGCGGCGGGKGLGGIGGGSSAAIWSVQSTLTLTDCGGTLGAGGAGGGGGFGAPGANGGCQGGPGGNGSYGGNGGGGAGGHSVGVLYTGTKPVLLGKNEFAPGAAGSGGAGGKPLVAGVGGADGPSGPSGKKGDMLLAE
jgi:hypothetical protein